MTGKTRGQTQARSGSLVKCFPLCLAIAQPAVIAALVFGASLYGASSVSAQESKPGRLELLLAQGVVAPGRIEKQFEAETEAKSTFEPIIPEGDEVIPPSEADAIKFVLSGVLVEGSTVYGEPDFQSIYESALGEEVSLGDIYRMAGRISAKYRGDGYILSRAVVPAQQIRDGLVKIQAIEGFINEVIIEGDFSRRESLLENYAAKIAAERPLTARTLERYLLLADDLAGLTAKAVLTPSIDIPGASDLVLFVDQKDYDLSVAIDNRGTRFVGPNEISFSAKFNSLLGLHESTTFRSIFASQPEELRFFQMSHTEVLGSEGTKFQMSYNIVRSRPGFTFSTTDGTNVESESQELSFRLSHPLIRTRSENLEVHGTFVWTKSLTDLFFEKLFDDRLRVLRAGMAYDFVDQFSGINLIEFELSQGLDILNATESFSNDNVEAELSRALGRSDFTKVTADVSRLQRLMPGVSLLGSVTGQYSRTQLLSAEEFGYGGASFGRAFDTSEITGDHGAAGKLELQYGAIAETPMIKDYQIYSFWDYGAVWRIDPVSLDDGNGHHSKTGSSLGFGVRFNVTDNISGYVEIDKPLTRDVSARGTDGEKPRAFFSMAARF